MSVTREDIWQEALSWDGTPFHKHQWTKGLGADCVGLIVGVGQNLGFWPDIKAVEGPWTPYLGWSHLSRPKLMHKALSSILKTSQYASPRKGDVLWLAAPMFPSHVAIYGEGELVHAWGPNRKVVKVTWLPGDPNYASYLRLLKIFSYPGFEADA